MHGAGDVGAQLTADPRIKIVSFTGGPGAGRAIARAAAEDFKVLQLELGGNNPVLVLDDADVDVTADGILEGHDEAQRPVVRGTGQGTRPARPRRAARRRADRARSRSSSSATRSTRTARSARSPTDRTSRPCRRRIDGLRGLGAEIHQPARLPELGGYFLSPTVAVGADPARATAELFGPVVSVHAVDSAEEALRIANANPSGLDAYVFGTDTDRAIEVGSRIVAGEVRVNGAKVADLGDDSAQSFWGPSGIGGHGPAESVRVFCGDRVVGVDSPGPAALSAGRCARSGPSGLDRALAPRRLRGGRLRAGSVSQVSSTEQLISICARATRASPYVSQLTPNPSASVART